MVAQLEGAIQRNDWWKEWGDEQKRNKMHKDMELGLVWYIERRNLLRQKISQWTFEGQCLQAGIFKWTALFSCFSFVIFKICDKFQKPVPWNVCFWVVWHPTHGVRCSPKRSTPPKAPAAHTKEHVDVAKCFQLELCQHPLEGSRVSLLLQQGFYKTGEASQPPMLNILPSPKLKCCEDISRANPRFYVTSFLMLSVFHKPCLDSEGILLGKP